MTFVRVNQLICKKARNEAYIAPHSTTRQGASTGNVQRSRFLHRVYAYRRSYKYTF